MTAVDENMIFLIRDLKLLITDIVIDNEDGSETVIEKTASKVFTPNQGKAMTLEQGKKLGNTSNNMFWFLNEENQLFIFAGSAIQGL